jgi:dynein heavy chain, axonemal
MLTLCSAGAQLFEDYRKVYQFGRSWNPDAYSSEAKTLRTIRLDMKEQRDWRNELEKMKISNVVGCLYVDSKSLRNDLIPVTTNTLDRIKLLLLAMARDSCLTCLEDTRARTTLLQARPTQLDEFMSYQASW